MRRIIESLAPDDRQIYWRWVGGMFALYVVLMITAAGVFVSHESSRKLAHESRHDCGNRPEPRRHTRLRCRCGRPSRY